MCLHLEIFAMRLAIFLALLLVGGTLVEWLDTLTVSCEGLRLTHSHRAS